jgi:hypothetical protein
VSKKETVEKQEQWQKVKEIVGAALEREPRERSAFLDEACAHDDKLRAEVESLLAAHADALSENQVFGTSRRPRAIIGSSAYTRPESNARLHQEAISGPPGLLSSPQFMKRQRGRESKAEPFVDPIREIPEKFARRDAWGLKTFRSWFNLPGWVN